MRIELDEDGSLELYVKEYLRDVVQKHVGEILKHQLKNIVAGELAKLKLDNPNTHSLHEAVEGVLEIRMRNAAGAVVPNIVRHEMKRHLDRMAQNIN